MVWRELQENKMQVLISKEIVVLAEIMKKRIEGEDLVTCLHLSGF